ncbi:MAG: PHP domain-containing protein [Ruminococcaceae bacterium]|nr:PHP domain-containing protein [Oscillospiraceae bacterium]
MSYLFEMHLHTDEVSRCANIPAKQIAKLYLATDYDGIVVTDHMNNSAFRKPEHKNAEWDKKVDHFLEGYNILKEELDGKMVVLLGMEINFYDSENDYLVYGVTEEFLRSNGDLMAYSPEDFSKLCKENGLLFLQAHPFRRGLTVEDWEILDGYEVFNGNPRHYSSNPIAEAWAKFHNKDIVVAGSDFHEIEDLAHGGVYFNNEIKTNDDLLRELKALNYSLYKAEFKHTR